LKGGHATTQERIKVHGRGEEWGKSCKPRSARRAVESPFGRPWAGKMGFSPRIRFSKHKGKGGGDDHDVEFWEGRGRSLGLKTRGETSITRVRARRRTLVRGKRERGMFQRNLGLGASCVCGEKSRGPDCRPSKDEVSEKEKWEKKSRQINRGEKVQSLEKRLGTQEELSNGKQDTTKN